MARKSNHPDQQNFLPALAEREAERRALVRSALARLPLQARVRRDFEQILLYLAANADAHGCRAYNRTLSAHLAIPKSSLRRLLYQLRDAGLIETRASMDRRGGGQSSNATRVNFAALRHLAQTPAAQRAEAQRPGLAAASSRRSSTLPTTVLTGAQNEHAPAQSEHPGAQNEHPHLKEYISLYSFLDNKPPPTSPVAVGDQAGEPQAGRGHLEFSATPGTAGVLSNRASASVATTAPAPACSAPVVTTADVQLWRAIESRLCSLGMAAADLALAAAKASGVTPAFVNECVDHWLASRPAWALGALYRRLKRAAPGQRADDPHFWPLPSEAFSAHQRQAARKLADEAAEPARRFYAIIRAARRAGKTGEEIRDQLHAACGSEFCRANGWP